MTPALHHPSLPMRGHRAAAALLTVNAIVLGLLSLFGLTVDLASCFRGIGPFGEIFLHSPLAIGVVEAHGLAFLLAAAALLLGARSGEPRWHLVFASVHLLLGSANIAFFAVFELAGHPLGGVAVTVLHFAFVALQSAAAAVRWRPAQN